MTRRAERVLVLTLVFPPESVSTAQLFGELVEDLVRQGRHVTVVTTKPHYHPETAAQMRSALTPDSAPERLYRPDASITAWRKLCEQARGAPPPAESLDAVLAALAEPPTADESNGTP